jgi:hypothetical protein
VGSDFVPPHAVRDLVQSLDNFNNGVGVPSPCEPTATRSVSWGAVKAAYR